MLEIDIISVVKQFTDQWKHPTQVPTVIRVRLFASAHGDLLLMAHVQLWKIYGDRAVFDQFSRYQ